MVLYPGWGTPRSNAAAAAATSSTVAAHATLRACTPRNAMSAAFFRRYTSTRLPNTGITVGNGGYSGRRAGGPLPGNLRQLPGPGVYGGLEGVLLPLAGRGRLRGGDARHLQPPQPLLLPPGQVREGAGGHRRASRRRRHVAP